MIKTHDVLVGVLVVLVGILGYLLGHWRKQYVLEHSLLNVTVELIEYRGESNNKIGKLTNELYWCNDTKGMYEVLLYNDVYRCVNKIPETVCR